MDTQPSKYGRARVQSIPKGKTRTKQSMAAECDINTIMQKYQKSGAIEHVNQHGPQYGEATSVDYHQAMNITKKAEQMFRDLPAEARKRFEQDPAQFMDFVQNDDNLEEMEELGLLNEEAGNRLKAIREAEQAEAAISPAAADPAPPEPEAPAG